MEMGRMKDSTVWSTLMETWEDQTCKSQRLLELLPLIWKQWSAAADNLRSGAPRKETIAGGSIMCGSHIAGYMTSMKALLGETRAILSSPKSALLSDP